MMSDARVNVCAQHPDHRRRLGELVVHFESDAKLHSKYIPVYTLRDGYEEYKARPALIGQMRRCARKR